MNAKEFLSRAWYLEQQVQSKLEQIERMRSLASRVTASFDKAAGHSRNVSSMQDMIVKIMETEEELNREIDELVTVRKEIAGVINRIRAVTLRLILEKRYLSFQSMEQIGTDLYYSERWIKIKHREALDAVQQIMDEREADEMQMQK